MAPGALALDGDLASGDADDGCDWPRARDTRGWAMRAGRCRRLRRVHGRESTRGRAAFARSVGRAGHGGRRVAPGRRDEAPAARRKEKRAWLEELRRGAHIEETRARVDDFDSDLADGDGDADDAWLLSEDLLQRLAGAAAADGAACGASGGTCSTGTGGNSVADSEESGPVQPRAPAPRSVPCATRVPRATTRWEQAVETADEVASKYCRPAAPGNGTGGEARARRSRRMRAEEQSSPACGSFEGIRGRFMKEHGHSILHELRQVFGGPVSMAAAPVSASVKARFVAACGAVGAGALRLVYHGTKASNHRSIFQRGLLVPGGETGVAVRNGASHGRGIYTSQLSAAWLSRGFCSEPRMLVCGVLDDAVAVATPFRLGNHYVTKESSAVRHVGSAIVVFDPCRVAPLFEAVAAVPDEPNAAPAPAPDDAAPTRRAAGAGRRLEQEAPRQALRGRAAAVAFLFRRAARRRQG